MNDLTPEDMRQIIERAIDARREFNAMPEDDAWEFLRCLLDASTTFYAIWPAANETHDGLRIKSSSRRKQTVGAFLVEDQKFAEAWKALQAQAETAPKYFHEMPAGVM